VAQYAEAIWRKNSLSFSEEFLLFLNLYCELKNKIQSKSEVSIFTTFIKDWIDAGGSGGSRRREALKLVETTTSQNKVSPLRGKPTYNACATSQLNSSREMSQTSVTEWWINFVSDPEYCGGWCSQCAMIVVQSIWWQAV
jgi:hypothetical protein